VNALLARCRIGCQIATLGLVGVIGMLLIAGINWWGASQLALTEARVVSALHGTDLEQRLQITLLQARRHEKDFLLHRTEKYAADHAASMAAIDRTLADLKAHLVGQPANLAKIEQITNDIGRYTSAFTALVGSARSVGLNEDQGLLGALRTSVHEVETALKAVDVPNAMVAMLMMRRHEKDFIARRDPKYGRDVALRLPEFVAALDAAGVPAATRGPIMAKMTAYQETFVRFMEATLAEQTATRILNAVFAEIEPRLATLDDEFHAQAVAAEQEGAAFAVQETRLILGSLVAIVLIVSTLCWLIGRGIARPIIRVTRSMEGLVEGNLETAVPADTRRDEIGTLVKAVQAFKDSLIAAARMREEQAHERDQAEADKRAALTRMAERIETEAGDAVQQISERTSAMTSTADEMRALAGRAGLSAQGAAGAAALALGNAQTVASAAEELSASIREISGQVNQSTRVVNQAVDAGTETRTTIEALNERVGRIGAVVDIIGDIAAKTNLLALNATIEAARAGDAGKGFAVVAGEVKQLASQTARSTEEITRHISEVRAATAAAVTAVSRIESTIQEVNAIAGSIAAAVEEQGAATAEIARNVTETASAVNEMSARNAEVSQEAEQAGRYAEDVLESTRVLDGAVGELKRAMVRTVRTATAEVDRRSFQRYGVAKPCQIDLAGKGMRNVRLMNISEGGAGLADAEGLHAGERGTLRVSGLSVPVAFRVLDVTDADARIAFETDEAGGQALRGFIGTIPMEAAA